MKLKHAIAALALGAGFVATPADAQTRRNPAQRPPPQETADQDRQPVPIFRATVVGRTTPAVNYRHRGGATKVDFRGTALLPAARGEAKVESKQGYIEIEVEFDELTAATKFGPEYLTYVMWAVTPEGRATNLGEVLLNGTESKLNVTTELQAFGLIVTAEPYFAVSQPSDVVVMENVVRRDTRGAVDVVEAKYELLKRGTYLMETDARDLPIRRLDPAVPLEIYEAQNAVYFARIAGADEYATETYDRARTLLARAESYQVNNQRRPAIMTARESAQASEDARLIALERRDAEFGARERRLILDRENAARGREVAATERATEAGEREAAALRRAEMERRQRQEAEMQRADADAERLAAEQRLRASERSAEDAAARLARERQSLETERAESERRRIELEAARNAAGRAQADADSAVQQLARERVAADARAQQLARDKADADARAAQAADAVAQAERERLALREKLQQQLNIILETRESARGLIVNMSDVLFDTGSATLKPGAREKLAKVAGVLLAYPALQIHVEGHTDDVGGDDYNQGLSERRADSVRAYLVQAGIARTVIDAIGYGEARPVVGNTTPAGRQQNRRVELVVSGEAIAAPAERRQ
ncbi:MAG TPA: OmpA family protein [Vicinamibacterales bacterium]|nr:OmpA family protein [Vicinamibacterales bacterium]